MQTEAIHPSRFKLLPLALLTLLFALPPLLGWIYFLNPQLLPTGRGNHGTLIDQPQSVLELPLRSENGERFNWGAIKGKWVLVNLTRGSCEKSCQEQLIQQRQIRLALGANRQRVARLLLILPEQQRQSAAQLPEGVKGTFIALANDINEAQLNKLFDVTRGAAQDSFYLIDPRGYLMMKYPSSLPSKAILQDLEKLLKASQSWVKGGQYGHK